MKKIFLALVAFALFAGCDDGDMTFKTFDFTQGSAPALCGDDRGTIFKINGSEVLLLNLDPSLLLRVQSQGEVGAFIPTRVAVGSTGPNRMYYRTYSSTPNERTFCASSGIPNLVDEWSGNGTVLITTTAVVDEATGAVTGYQYSFTIESATFSNGEQEVTILDSFLGQFTEPNNFTFNFSGTGSRLSACADRKIAYKTNGVESLELRFQDDSYLSGDDEKTIDLNDDAVGVEDLNNLYFRKFNTSVTGNNICSGEPSGTVQVQLWRAISGIVRIRPRTNDEDTTITNYEIRLENVIFSNNDAPRELYSPANTTGFNYYLMGEL